MFVLKILFRKCNLSIEKFKKITIITNVTKLSDSCGTKNYSALKYMSKFPKE